MGRRRVWDRPRVWDRRQVRRIATIEAPRPLAPSALLADPWMLRKVLEGRRQAFKEDRRQALGDRRRVRCLYRSEEVPLFRAPLRARRVCEISAAR